MNFLFDPFAIVIALLPLVAYLLVLSLIRLSGRALVTTGAREIAAISIAVCGMVAVGPAELLFPTTAAMVYGPVVWLGLIAFYCLVVALVALTSKPRLSIYGRNREDSFQALIRAAERIDETTTADDQQQQVHLAKLGVRLRVDSDDAGDHCRIVSFQRVESLEFWHRLLANMRSELQSPSSQTSRGGAAMLLFALVLGGIVVWQAVSFQSGIVEGFRDWLWR